MLSDWKTQKARPLRARQASSNRVRFRSGKTVSSSLGELESRSLSERIIQYIPKLLLSFFVVVVVVVVDAFVACAGPPPGLLVSVSVFRFWARQASSIRARIFVLLGHDVEGDGMMIVHTEGILLCVTASFPPKWGE